MSSNMSSLGVLFLVWLSSSISADKDVYRAAVLELVQFADMSCSPSKVAQKNLKVYELASKAAASEKVDIIVFPEYGTFPLLKMNRSIILELSEDIPNPKIKNYNPCKEKDAENFPILKKLSCIAQESGLFVVANVIDRKNCEFTQFCDANSLESCTESTNECPDDGNFYYNTNVVFNREGVLVAKYYKKHLYFEPHMKTSDYLGNVYFETDFGTFTTAIGFDLVYKDLVDAINEPKVANVAYSTYWFNHLPHMFMAVPIQQAFAIANKVNLLAANIQDPRIETIEGGIYNNDGVIVPSHPNKIPPNGGSNLLISEVPKVADDSTYMILSTKHIAIEDKSKGDTDDDIKFRKSSLSEYCTDNICAEVLGEPELEVLKDEFSEYRCSFLLPNTLQFVKLQGKEGKLEICSGTFCCFLSYKAMSMDEEYFLGYTTKPFIFHGRYELASEVCFLARCDEVSGVACQHYKNSQTVFQMIRLKGNFSTQHVYPFAIDSGIKLTHVKHWLFRDKSEILYANLDTNSSIEFLGLHGRIFNADKEHIN